MQIINPCRSPASWRAAHHASTQMLSFTARRAVARADRPRRRLCLYGEICGAADALPQTERPMPATRAAATYYSARSPLVMSSLASCPDAPPPGALRHRANHPAAPMPRSITPRCTAAMLFAAFPLLFCHASHRPVPCHINERYATVHHHTICALLLFCYY